MNDMKITFDGEIVRRWKETAKSGKEMVYIAVKVPRGEFSDVLKIKARDIEAVKPYEVGAKVAVEAFVGGREWTNTDTGKISYFTDVNLYKIASIPTANDSDAAGESPSADDDIPF